MSTIFIESEFNHEAILAARRIVNEEASLVFVTGPSGVGKTYILHEIQYAINDRFPSKKLYLTNGRTMLDALKEHIMTGTFIDKYDVLLVDDFDLVGLSATQDFFYRYFCSIIPKTQVVLVVGSEMLDSKLMLDLRAQYNQSIFAKIDYPDENSKLTFANSCAQNGLLFSSDQITKIIRSTTFPQLHGLLLQIAAMSGN